MCDAALCAFLCVPARCTCFKGALLPLISCHQTLPTAHCNLMTHSLCVRSLEGNRLDEQAKRALQNAWRGAPSHLKAAIAAEWEREVGEFRRQREAEEARRLEEERLAEARRLEEERLAEARRLEEERLAQAVAEAERLAAEAASKAEAERLAVEAKTVADTERLAAWARTVSPEAQRAVADRDARALVAMLQASANGSRQSVASGIAILADAPPDQSTDPMREALATAGVYPPLVAMLGDGTAEERAAAAEACCGSYRATLPSRRPS